MNSSTNQRATEMTATPHDAEPCYLLCVENIDGLAREHCAICGDRLTVIADGSWAHRADVEGGAGPIQHPAGLRVA